MSVPDIEKLREIYLEICSLTELYEKASVISRESEINDKAELLKGTRDRVLKATMRAKEILMRLEDVSKS